MRILGVVLLAFAAMVAVPSTTARAGGKTPIDEAVEHFAAGRFDDAIASTEKVAADDPLRARAAYLAGEVSIARGDALGAEAYLREALDKKQAAPVFAALGRALLLQGKAADAVEPLAKAVALDAKPARYHAWLAVARLRAGDADAAKRDLVIAAKLAPDDGDVVRAAVEERLAAQDADAAMKAAVGLSKARKDHALGPFLEGVVLDRAGKTDDAIKAYQRALALDEGFLDAHKNLAILCVTQNPLYSIPARTKLAMEHFAAYEARGGKDAEVLHTYETLKSFLASQGGTTKDK